ncbi:cysteine desulfurase family protein [Kroppenstedtia eburnea]|uniref:cysteine desulfurase family protein n=1 Tax=Kroppenstedtia eburnea TaxID=714067 RepID=UPI003637D055
MLYMDNSATTPILPEVREAMIPYLLEEFGNPSGKYYSVAENAKNAVREARKQVASLLGCEADEVIFTSGSTESNNMIIKGVAHQYKNLGRHVITSKTEHPSVMETCRFLEQEGYKVTFLDVDQFGRVDVDSFLRAVKKEKPILVTIMWGNNEIGSLNPVEEIANLCAEHKILFHTDATQVVGKVPHHLADHPGIRFLSCSAHKFHGPKGVGVAVIRKDELGIPTKLTPLLHGGGQEMEYRSGTLAVHNIVGMGRAADLAQKRLQDNIHRLEHLEQKLTAILKEKFSDHLIFNNDTEDKVPGIISVQFKGVNNETLLRNLAPAIAASTGSACSSSKPSHVLDAIGLSLDQVRSTIRFSLSPYINEEELDVFYQL